MNQRPCLSLRLCVVAIGALALTRSQRGGPCSTATLAFTPKSSRIPRRTLAVLRASGGANVDVDVDHAPSVDLFREWCDSVGLRAPRLEHAPTDGGIPGVTVRPGASLTSGELAIVLPLDATLSVLADEESEGVDRGEHPGACSSSSSVLSDDMWSDAGPGLRLAARLLHERSLGSASRYHGYILHGLPPVSGPGRERCDALGRWTDAELRLLRSPALTRKAEDRRRLDDEWFHRLSTEEQTSEAVAPAGDEHDDGAAPAPVCTREEFDWAMDVVRTRHFRGDFAAGLRRGSEERKGDYALLPFIDDMNHRGPATTEASFHVESPAAGVPSDDAPPPMVLPPVVSGALNRTSDAICWVANRSFREGNEVSIAYLTGTDAIAEAFLDEWGFVLSSDEMDACAVYSGDIRCVVRGGGRFHDEDSMVDDINAEMLARHFDDADDEHDEAPTRGDTWRRVAKACYNEFVLFGGSAEDDSAMSSEETVSPSRRAIANMFVDGKQRLLHAGMQHALLRAEGQV